MPVENVELVRRFLASVNEWNLDAALAQLAPDAELDWSDSDAPDRGIYRGPEQWGQWLSGRWEGLDDARFEETEVIDVPPDTVLLVAHLRARGRVSGLETAALAAAVWTLRQGQISGLRLYQTRDEALRSLGLVQ